MGSKSVDLLSELRSRSQIDCDTLDVTIAKDLGPFIGSTSNQADAYLELLLLHRADMLEESLLLARQISGDYTDVPFKELAFEIAASDSPPVSVEMVKLSLAIAPHVKETVFVMSNPSLTSSSEVVKNASRIVALTSRVSPAFPLSRLCIKVAATWEGLQACRQLTALGISTLATTVFTIEQAILAGECGCIYISPFVHELKAAFDESYDDGGANLAVCVEAQRYYEYFSYPTRVKAAALLTVEETKRLAGVASITIPPDLLRTLAATETIEDDVDNLSLFAKVKHNKEDKPVRRVYIDDEAGWREAFGKANNGKGSRNTAEAIDEFREYQLKAEQFMLMKGDW